MVDVYTKLVLSIIATALVIIAAETLTRPSRADSNLQKVLLCDGSRCLKLEHRGGHDFIPSMMFQPDIPAKLP